MEYKDAAVPAVALVLIQLAGCLGGPLSDPDVDPEERLPTVPDNGSQPCPGARRGTTDCPHVHDRWNERTRLTVIDRTVSTGTTGDVDPRRSIWWNLGCGGGCPQQVTFAPKPERIVPPGTDEITFRASWQADLPPRSEFMVSVYYMAANMTSFRQLAGGIASGSSHTVNTSVPMADGGHARQSLWRFRITVSQCIHRPRGVMCVTGADTDPGPLRFNVTVRADRDDGPLPKEPPHPDWWADGPSRRVATVRGRADTIGAGSYAVNASMDPARPETIARTSYAHLPGDEVAPVPPGTKSLAARVNWTNAAAPSDAAGLRPWLGYRHSGGDGTWRVWAPAQVGDGTATFVQPLEADQTDGMYVRNRSRWTFLLSFEGDRDTGVQDPLLAGRSVTSPYRFDGRYTLEVRAFNATRLPAGWADR